MNLHVFTENEIDKTDDVYFKLEKQNSVNISLIEVDRYGQRVDSGYILAITPKGIKRHGYYGGSLPTESKVKRKVKLMGEMMSNDFVTVSIEDYKQMKEDQKLLDAFFVYGVDNWSGYGMAVASLNEESE